MYHQRTHGALNNISPLERYQQDLVHIRPLRLSAEQYGKLFYHHLERTVRKDATISYAGTRYEVPFSHSGDKVILVIDPHRQLPLHIESLEGDTIGSVTPLDYHANARRRRHRPRHQDNTDDHPSSPTFSTVEQALIKQMSALTSTSKRKTNKQ